MRRSSWLLVPAFVLAAACSKGGDKARTRPAADTATAAAPGPPGGDCDGALQPAEGPGGLREVLCRIPTSRWL